MRNAVFCAVFTLCLLPAIPSLADTPLDMLGLEKSINDVSRRAQETGDEITNAFAKQALEIIKAWKEANKDLIDTAFDRLDKQSQALFTELQNAATRLEKAEAVTFVDLQRTLANAGASLAAVVPGSKQPQVFFYWPSVALPKGERSINVRVIGTYIANGNPTVTVGNQTLPVKKYSDNEVGFDLDRANLKVSASEVELTVFPFRYHVSTSKWYNPFSWWSEETRQRDLEIRTLPTNPGSASIIFQVREDGWEYANLLPEIRGKTEIKWVMLGGRGKDKPYDATYTLTPERQEQKWVIDKTKQKEARWDDNEGDGNGGSSCTGFNEGAFTDKSFTFRVQHGSVGRSDAYQNCRVFDIFVKRPKVIESYPTATTGLDWLSPVPIPIPPNTAGYDVRISLYTGRSYPITDKLGVPYDLFDVLRTEKEIIFQPREQRDF